MTASRPSNPAASVRPLWLPLALLLLALVLRAIKSTPAGQDWLPNFSPWMALAFAGTALLPRALPWWLPTALLVVGDILIHSSLLLHDPLTMSVIYLSFALAAFAAARWRARLGALGILGGTLACTLLFYLVTNTLSWALLPGYAKTLNGLWQALTTGLPGFPPAWTFLRNSLLSDLGFTVLLVLAHNVEAAGRRLPALGWSRAPVVA